MANMITFLRVILVLIAISILKLDAVYNVLGCSLIILSLLLDAVDGYLARFLNTASIPGGIYDILADRLIENILFIYFASLSLFNIWFSIIILMRGLTADAIRSVFSHHNKTAFGESSLHSRNWSKLLVSSRWSRGGYNTAKILTFSLYSLLIVPSHNIFNYIPISKIYSLAEGSLWVCVGIALIRTYPVIYEIAHYHLRHSKMNYLQKKITQPNS